MFKKAYRPVFVFVALILTSNLFGYAQTSSDKMWKEIDDADLQQRALERQIVPTAYKTFSLNKAALRSVLQNAPEEFSDAALVAEVILSIPMPDGTYSRFRIEHSPIVEPGLSAKYPELGETYRGQGIDDPTATVRFDFLPSGFHAMILSTKGSIYVDPYAKDDTSNYISYFKASLPRRMNDWSCLVKEGQDDLIGITKSGLTPLLPFSDSVISGATLRTYRLALAATNEYAAAVGGTTAGTLAAQVLIMNRVNGVYEKDVAIRMVIIANNNLIVHAGDNTTCGGVACTAANDGYTNFDGLAMLSENQTKLDAAIMPANYDIGHVFSTGGGGVASLNSPCSSAKARGVTGLPTPLGDAFAIDYVAHEMGHQWGSNHTYNGTSGSCGGQRSSSNAFEPGSGITIMAYAGICSNQNLAPNSIDTFHVRSLEVIVAFSQINNGNTCSQQAATGNTPPTVTLPGGSTFNIPKQTPFSLTASATDPNGDTLTYDWQQYDAGGATGGTTAVPNTDSDGIARPLFRNYIPTASGTRFFPSLQYIRNNANVPPSTTGGSLTGELLPAITRTMNFQVVVRDNRANGGGINTAAAVVNVDGNSGPFVVTAPNTGVTWNGNSSQTVTWNVANTTAAPVNAANVKLSFSTDGGLTFPTTILASTPNDGTEIITVPNIGTIQGRIKVEGLSNIFFDISDVNFTINAVAATARAPFDYDGDNKTDLSIFRPAPGQWWYQRSIDGGNAALTFGSSTDRIVPADYTGDNKTDFAFWRPSTGEWFILRSEDFSFFAFPFGIATDVPVPADYDGDGKADAAVYRPSTNTWFINRSTGGTDILGFGTSGDVPVVGNFDGDTKADIAIFRPSVGQWWIRRSSDLSVFAAAFGSSTDKPVQGDYTGDGKADMAFWRPSTGEWFILRSEDFSFFAFPFGLSTDVPVPGDYDGDGKFDAGVFRPSNSNWFIQRSTAGTLIQLFGIAGDIPTPNAYVP